jgi:uncharacterized protein YndB with AHSA1/START domain
MSRADTAARIVKAPAADIYQAHLDPDAVARWRPPEGMRAEIYSFDPRVGGSYRMAFIYAAADEGSGKTTADADVFTGEFVALDKDRRIVERVRFESDDPAYAGLMTITTTLEPRGADTEVTIVCENVPSGISAEDHAAGMGSTLANLAALVE